MTNNGIRKKDISGAIAGVVLVIMSIIIAGFMVIAAISIKKMSTRHSNGMVHITDNYSYNKDTYIIYTEYTEWLIFTKEDIISISFAPYVDSNGCMYKYNPDTNEWINLGYTSCE